MTSHFDHPRGPCPRRCTWLFALALLCGLPAVGGGPWAAGRETADASPPTPAAAAAVPAWSWSQVYSPIESLLGNRRRMIQVLIVLMCVGLYIMMRKAVPSDE